MERAPINDLFFERHLTLVLGELVAESRDLRLSVPAADRELEMPLLRIGVLWSPMVERLIPHSVQLAEDLRVSGPLVQNVLTQGRIAVEDLEERRLAQLL